MDSSRGSDSCITSPLKPELTQEPNDPNPRTKEEKIHLLDSPKDKKKEAPDVRVLEEECARERLKKHRQEMAGRVWIPDIWGQESNLLKESIMLDRSLVPKGLLSAREALVRECTRSARPIRVNKSC